MCLCGGETRASWFCPALPCTVWGSVLDRGPALSLRHAAPLQPLQSTDSHWHYISSGKHSKDTVCVSEYMLLSAWAQQSSLHISPGSEASSAAVGKGIKTMAVRIIRGMEDLVASGSQLVWSMAHQTLRSWYNSGMMPCRRFLDAWFTIGKCYQVWQLLEPWQRKYSV